MKDLDLRMTWQEKQMLKNNLVVNGYLQAVADSSVLRDKIIINTDGDYIIGKR